MKVLYSFLLLILLSSVWACKKTDEERLVEYLKQAYPPEYPDHVKLGALDSVYDPYDSLCTLFNKIDSVKDMPIMEAILHGQRFWQKCYNIWTWYIYKRYYSYL